MSNTNAGRSRLMFGIKNVFIWIKMDIVRFSDNPTFGRHLPLHTKKKEKGLIDISNIHKGKGKWFDVPREKVWCNL